MRKKILSIAIFAFTFLNVNSQTPIYLDESKPIEERVTDALSRMTLQEKVKLCHAQSKFSSYGVSRLGIPELWMSDGPHGVRAEINWNNWNYAGWTNDSITVFPALTCLAATWNPDMAAKYGKAIGEEALYREKDVILGPGVNIYRTPLNGRNFEYMGEDPYLASVMCVPYIKELQKNGVAACVKHYALNNQEQWRGHINVELSDRALHEIYLPAFKAAVEEGGAWSIMGSYNKIRGQHACHNDLMLNKILKNDWKFDGAVITDWGGCHDTKEAALNGLDIEMGSYTNGLTSESAFTFDDYFLARPYLEMIQKGEVSESTVNEKAARILRLIFRTAMKRNKPLGSNVENFIRGANCTVMTVGDSFKPPTRFIFAYEYSPTCVKMMKRIAQSDLLRLLQCHLVYVGDHPEILREPEQYLKDANLDVITEYRYGDVAENILEYQNEHGIQLIVLGAFSHSKIHQFFLGSIATTIFRNAKVPLLVAR